MTKSTLLTGVSALLALLVLGFLVLIALDNLGPDHGPLGAPMPPDTPPEATATGGAEAWRGFLHGRVTTDAGEVLQGRLRWGGDEEAFWDDAFNGYRAANPWAEFLTPEDLRAGEGRSILGVRIGGDREIDLDRPFMARFGDLRSVERDGRDLFATLKSGTRVRLDRMNADDFADGIRVWDATRGIVDLGERQLRSVEFLATPEIADPPRRLHGAVRTGQGDFTGFVQWNRKACVATDELVGDESGGRVRLPFHTIRSIERQTTGGTRVTLEDGTVRLLTGSPDVAQGNRGVTVDDPRFGRVLVRWDAFLRLDLEPADSGPGYDDYAPGEPLSGSILDDSGRRLAGRLVFDLDESETTETLDAPSGGVHYAIPLGLVASIVPGEGGSGPLPVTLHSGERLRLERSGDLADGNGGMLVFPDGGGQPEFVRWRNVTRIEFARPAVPVLPTGDGTAETGEPVEALEGR